MSQEKEIVIICKIGDFNGFKEAEQVIEQEQLEFFRKETGARIRCRKSVDDEGTKFQVCVKSKSKLEGGTKATNETEELITSSFFENFRNIAETLQVKKRYIFRGEHTLLQSQNKNIELPVITYEVDVFERHDGKISEWCKIDIEVQDIMEAIRNTSGVTDEEIEFTIKTTHLPFKPQMAFIVGACTEEQLKASMELYDKEWTRGPFGGPRVPVEASVSNLSNNSQHPEPNQNSEADNGQEQTNEGV